MSLVLPISLLGIGIVCFGLIKMHKYKHRSMRYIANSLIGASIVAIIYGLYMILSKVYDRGQVRPDYYNNLIGIYSKQSINVFIYIGVLGLFLSMILMIIIKLMKNKIMNK